MHDTEEAQRQTGLRRLLNETTYNFMFSQIRMQLKKPKDGRLTYRDTIFAVSLLKQSEWWSKFLRRIFSLSLKITITTLWNKIPFVCGINANILDSLKTAATSEKKTMNLNYAPTYFLFLTKCLFKWGYNSTKSVVCIDGFVDMGGECRKMVVGDHVFVFIYSFLAYIWRKLRGECFKYLIPRNFN